MSATLSVKSTPTVGAVSAPQIDEATALHTASKLAFYARVESLGEAARLGKQSIVDAARAFGEQCNPEKNDRVFSEDDAGAVYAAFVKGHNGDTRVIDAMDNAQKASISIFKTFGRPNVARYGATLWEQVIEVRSTIGKDDRAQSSAYGALTKVNREFEKLAVDKGFAAAKLEATDEWIEALLTKGDVKSKSDADKAAELLKRLRKLAEGETLVQTQLAAKLVEADILVAKLVALEKSSSKTAH